MTTSSESTDSSIVAAERVLLCALCHGGTPLGVETEIFQAAAAHKFRDEENEIVFRALREIGPQDPADLRFHLAAHLTRLGFPDLNLDELLAGAAPTNAEVRGALDRFAAARASKT